jgi:hypothetical protein
MCNRTALRYRTQRDAEREQANRSGVELLAQVGVSADLSLALSRANGNLEQVRQAAEAALAEANEKIVTLTAQNEHLNNMVEQAEAFVARIERGAAEAAAEQPVLSVVGDGIEEGAQP